MYRLPVGGERGALLARELVGGYLTAYHQEVLREQAGAGAAQGHTSPGAAAGYPARGPSEPWVADARLAAAAAPAGAGAGGGEASDDEDEVIDVAPAPSEGPARPLLASPREPSPSGSPRSSAGPGAATAAPKEDGKEEGTGSKSAWQKLKDGLDMSSPDPKVVKAEAAEKEKEERERADAFLAEAMASSYQDHCERTRRPGIALELPHLAELRLAYERQRDGSDTCAIHSLNNLVQPAPEELDSALAASLAKAAAMSEAVTRNTRLEAGGAAGPPGSGSRFAHAALPGVRGSLPSSGFRGSGAAALSPLSVIGSSTSRWSVVDEVAKLVRRLNISNQTNNIKQKQSPAGPFCLPDLQEAELEVRQLESQDGFLPLRPVVGSSLDLDATLQPGDAGYEVRSPMARTGMFELEAVKLAARNKGYEVIEIHPTPVWAEAEAGRYARAARDLEDAGCRERWFLGFLVYERIPGRAMHYYAILRLPGREAGADGLREDRWVILDSLDRGETSPRNRLLTTQELAAHHDDNGEHFRSWLVRWYPVVSRSAAASALCDAINRGARAACGTASSGEKEQDLLNISSQRGKAALESALDSEEARWCVAAAAENMLGAVPLVRRELHVLQLAVSEQQVLP